MYKINKNIYFLFLLLFIIPFFIFYLSIKNKKIKIYKYVVTPDKLTIIQNIFINTKKINNFDLNNININKNIISIKYTDKNTNETIILYLTKKNSEKSFIKTKFYNINYEILNNNNQLINPNFNK